MDNQSKPYQLDLRLGKLHDVPKYEFDRLRSMGKLFEWREKRPRLLRIYKKYYAWIEAESGKAHFSERTPNPDRSRSLLIDSCILVERKCAPHDRRYIQDPVLRALEVIKDYT